VKNCLIIFLCVLPGLSAGFPASAPARSEPSPPSDSGIDALPQIKPLPAPSSKIIVKPSELSQKQKEDCKLYEQIHKNDTADKKTSAACQ
jgi:hypothetical protein